MPCPQSKTPAGSSIPTLDDSRAARAAAYDARFGEGTGHAPALRHTLFEVFDQADYLDIAHQGFEAVELLLQDGGDAMPTTRGQLSCLLRLLNMGMRAEIDKTARLIAQVREAL